MSQNKLASKTAVWGATALSILGAAVSVILLVSSFKYGFDWYQFIPAVLYILAFAALGSYALAKGFKSVVTFRSVLISYGFVVLMTGVVFPPVYPHGTKYIFLALSILILIGLVAFDRKWSDVKTSKIIITVAYAAEVAASLCAVIGNPMMMEGNFVAQVAAFIRPIILSTMAVCYLSRMQAKKQGK